MMMVRVHPLQATKETIQRRVAAKTAYLTAVASLNQLSGRDDEKDANKKQQALDIAKKLGRLVYFTPKQSMLTFDFQMKWRRLILTM